MKKTIVRLLNSDYSLVFEREYYLEFYPDFFIHDGEVYQRMESDSITYQHAGSSLELQ